MKKLILIYSFALGLSLSMNAQVRQANGTTLNVATNSSAFFDASSTTSWNSSANIGKGLLYPRVRLSLFTSFSTSGTPGIANNYPSLFDGFIVYNTDTSGVAGIGATQGGLLSRGFWYYENKSASLAGGTWKLVGTSQVEVINTIAANGKALTGNGIIVTGGDSAVLKSTGLRLDSTAIAKFMGQSPVKDSVIKTITSSTMFRDSITSVITQGLISGKNVTAGNLVSLTGSPVGASLKDFGISVDTTAMKTFISKTVTQSPIKDSIGNAITNIINNNSVTGKDVTAGNLVTLTGTPAGASLKDFGISVDTTAMKTFISNSVTNNTIVGQNTTGGSLVTVTNGTGASLKAMTVAVNTTALKDSISKYVTQSPIKDSIGNAVTNIINNNSVTGKDVTAGNMVTLTGTPAGSSLKDFGISVDTAAMKTFISNSVTNNTITGQNTTGGSLVTVTNGAGASLKAMTVAVNITALKDSMSKYVTQSPIKDSIGNAITNIINNNSVTGKDVTAGNLVTLTGTPAGASLKDFGISVDTTAMKTFITNNAKAVLAKNGLTRTVDTIELGGALTKATTVTTSATNTLALAGLQSGAAGDSIVTIDQATSVIKKKTAINAMDPRMKFFYAPSISIPVTAIGTGLTVNLYDQYTTNFSTPAVKNPSAPAAIPVFAASELNYYISSFDPSVFANVSISNLGVMTYDVISTTPSYCSFVNVIFSIK